MLICNKYRKPRIHIDLIGIVVYYNNIKKQTKIGKDEKYVKSI